MFDRAVKFFENTDRPFSHYLVTFLFVVAIRYLLEIFIYLPSTNYAYLFHFYVLFSACILSFIMVFSLATGDAVSRVSRVVLGGFCIVLLAPLLDLILKPVGSLNLSYFLPGYHDDLAARFLRFFGRSSRCGISLGLRIELALLLFFSFAYLYRKTGKLPKSLFYTFLLYAILFLYASILYLILWFLRGLGVPIERVRMATANYFLLPAIFVQGCVIFYLADRAKWQAVVGNMRFTRVLHYVGMFFLGLVLGVAYVKTHSAMDTYGEFLSTLPSVFVYLPCVCMSILCAILYSIAVNDMEDRAIDQVCNTQRPLVTSALSRSEYARLASVFLVLALACAYAVSHLVFVCIAAFIGNYYIYSAPPFRFKRVPVISKSIIAFNSLLLLLVGAKTVSGTLGGMSLGMSALFLLCVTLSANFIDLKDYEGDRSQMIRTLPVLAGLPKAKLFIGMSFIIGYCALIVMIPVMAVKLVLGVLGAMQFYCVNRRVYDERYVMRLHLYTVAVVLFYFLEKAVH